MSPALGPGVGEGNHLVGGGCAVINDDILGIQQQLPAGASVGAQVGVAGEAQLVVTGDLGAATVAAASSAGGGDGPGEGGRLFGPDHHRAAIAAGPGIGGELRRCGDPRLPGIGEIGVLALPAAAGADAPAVGGAVGVEMGAGQGERVGGQGDISTPGIPPGILRGAAAGVERAGEPKPLFGGDADGPTVSRSGAGVHAPGGGLLPVAAGPDMDIAACVLAAGVPLPGVDAVAGGDPDAPAGLAGGGDPAGVDDGAAGLHADGAAALDTFPVGRDLAVVDDQIAGQLDALGKKSVFIGNGRPRQEDAPALSGDLPGLDDAGIVDGAGEEIMGGVGGEDDPALVGPDEALVLGQGVQGGFFHGDGKQPVAREVQGDRLAGPPGQRRPGAHR